MLKKILFSFGFMAIINCTIGQITSCGFDEIRLSNPENLQKEIKLNKVLYQKALESATLTKDAKIILNIPVVVHLIHQNGPENLADASIVSAINQMNQRFQNSAPYFDATGNAVNIQFCLASIDPQGNPTTGITRNYSQLSYLWASDDIQMKDLNRWDPFYYYNIWSVHSIYGFNISVAGYSSLPSNIGESIDGVVILYSALNSDVLTHETGHYLGLYHTFQGGCNNFNCLLDGDMVCDTPPDTSTSVCMGNSCYSDMYDTTGFSPFTSDVNELPNYMDYTPCALSFSQGQSDRMVNSLTAIRTLLLQSAGCGFSGGAAPVANLGYSISSCNDGSVSFIDTLSTNYTTVNWDFNNDGIFDSFNHNPVYSFPATGNYTVKLVIAGAGGVDTSYQTIFVQKSPSLYYPITLLGSIFTNSNGELTSCPDYSNNLTSAPGLSYLWSTGATTQTISFNPVSTYTITLTMIDSAGLTWTNQFCHPLIVNVHPSPPTANIYSNDPLTICDGDLVTIHSGFSTTGSYTFLWYQNSQITSSNDTIYNAVGFSPSAYYQLIIGDTNGCYSWSNYLYINSYSPPLAQSLTQNGFELTSGWGGGNQWYLNGSVIPGATGTVYSVTQDGCYQVEWFFSFAPNCTTMSDSICYTSTEINNIKAEINNAVIYPVPSSNFATLLTSSKLVGSEYYITDALGRIFVKSMVKSETSIINISDFASGIYFFNLNFNDALIVRKILKE
ncbi:MAG: T9SS type A sorting domain-containing protein [Bacteroidetes bacterium]|nr:T9SS type A sorting domain-containing protein [Bacteroidota bacterium]